MGGTLIFTIFCVWLSIASASSQVCYFPGGAPATNHTRCDDNEEMSACCSAEAMCLRNGACLEGGILSRGSCTDLSWNSSACFPYCRNGSSIVNDTNVIIPCDAPKAPYTYLGCNIADCQAAAAAAVQAGATGPPEKLFEMAGNTGNVILRQNQSISEVLSGRDPRTNLSTNSTDRGCSSPNSTSGNDTSGNGTTNGLPPQCPSSSNSGAMAGVGVGVGVPLLIVIGVLSWLLLRKKKNAGLGAVHEHNGYATKTPGPPHQIATEQASPHGYNNLPVQPPLNIAKTSINTASPEMEAERRYG